MLIDEYHQRIIKCQNCPRKGRITNGHLHCTVDGANILAHAESGECPLGFYVPGATITTGRAGVPRPIAGPNAASPRTIALRQTICAACDHSKGSGGKSCDLCGCSLGSKLRDYDSNCPAGYWPNHLPRERWFSHTGAIGDVIYALHAIRAAGGGSLYIHHDASIRREHYMKPWHAAALTPLLALQPYLHHFELTDPWPTATHPLDTFRDLGIYKNDLISLHHKAIGLPTPGGAAEHDPWLTVDRAEHVAPVVIHRSARYRNRFGEAIWERICAAYPDKVFVGLPAEHADFCDRFGDVPYHPTKDLLELARVITGAQLYCGNQSSPFAIATGLGVPTVLEVDPLIPDCCFLRDNAVHAWTPDVELPKLGTPAPRREPIVHVFHDLDLTGHPDRARVENARWTWVQMAGIDQAYKFLPFTPTRTSRDIGDTRAVPYLRDLLDAATEGAIDSDIVVWSNLDICLVPEASRIIRRKLRRGPCCFSRRVDVDDARPHLFISDLHGRAVHGGTDLFAFRASWWRRRRLDMPDMFLACEAFDFVLRHLMLADHPLAEITPPIIYHERHEAFWAKKENIADNPAQKHNRGLAVEWCRENGFDDRLFGEESAYLLRDDLAVSPAK